MRHELLRLMGTVAVVGGVLFLAPESFAGQAPKVAPTSKSWTPSKTPWGDPDLQGVWSNTTAMPLERPDPNAPRRVWTEDEANARKGANAGTYNEFWSDNRKASERTSMIIDPPDGRQPPLTKEARQREAARLAARRGRGDADSWEDRHRWERCTTLGLPILPTPYNNNFQILQTPGYVTILQEMIHDVRIIPLDGRPHGHVRSWLGDSRAQWEGQTLVIDTTNFNDKLDGGAFIPARQGAFVHLSVHRGSGETLHLIERLTLVDANTINYEFTIDDPKTFTRPWTGAIPAARTDEKIFEYACHEGNYGLQGILAGARAQEAQEKSGR